MIRKIFNKIGAKDIKDSNINLAENINIYNQPPPESKPVVRGKTNNLPPRNTNFTGRETILKDIHKSFRSGNNTVLTQVVTGLGGIGKTQTAIEYAHRCADDYDIIWLINAESPETLLKEFTDFAHYLGLADKDANERAIILNSVKDWMADNVRWLFIFDNAEKQEDIKDYIPGFCGGNILLTSRNKGWRNCKELDIEEFTPDEAAEFLIKSTGIDDESGAKELSDALGYLPLALEQAAAYITNNKGTDYKKYIDLYKKYSLKIFDSEICKPDNYSGTVTVTWNISLEKIKNESSKQLLNVCSFFSGDGIDKSIFPSCSECLPEPLTSDVKEELNYNKVLYELTRYSLIKDNGDSFSIHRLLQEVIRNSTDKKQWLQYCLNITYGKFRFNQYDMGTWKGFSSLLAHAFSIAVYAEEEGVRLEEAGRICNDAGLWLRQTVANEEALKLLKKAIIIGEKVYGNDHSNTAAAYDNIGGVYREQGKYTKALEWYEKALQIEERESGKDHRNTAATYNNIAAVYENQGKYQKALKLYEKAHEIYERELGKDHPSTAVDYNNIAGVYREQGEYTKALEWYEKALKIRERVLGKDHPGTAATYNNIAGVYYYQGEYTKALEWYEKALVINEKVLGKEHPDTAATYNNIAGVYNNQGEYTKALEWYEKALVIDEKVLGKEHPDTAAAYNNIALVYNNQGEYTKALEWNEKALEIREKVLRKDHPDTAVTYNNIAGVYGNQGEYTKALEWYEKALVIDEKVMGKEHPDTANTYNNIALVYYYKGEKEKALELLIRAYKIYAKRQMTEYPNAKGTFESLYVVYIKSGGKQEDFKSWLDEKLKEE